MSSPFLKIPESEWVASNTQAFAIRDRYPVSPGHTLVIPRRLVSTWFEATQEEQRALFELVDEVKRGLDSSPRPPDGYNIGINVGEAAGQTVFHLHVHVIPRFQGDMADPRGGVRHVIPGKGNYLVSTAKPLATGGLEDPFLRHLEPLFSRATEVAVLAAFVQDSGLEVLRESVEAALARGARVRILTGDYLAITQAKALRRLLDWMDESEARRAQDEEQPEAHRGTFEARVVETEKLGRSFHPKSWRFAGSGLAAAFVGSSNVSHAALRTGVEWNLRVERDRDPRAYQEVVDTFEGWWTRALRFDAAWVERYETRARQMARPLPSGEAEAEPVDPPRKLLVDGKEPELPPGCSVQVELEAKALLRRLLSQELGRGKVERAYRELKEVWGRRPTASELYRLGPSPETNRKKDWGWFQLIAQQEDLTTEQSRALAKGRDWFLELETTSMSKSFKMVLLAVLLDAGALETGLPMRELATRSLEMLLRSPELRGDIEGVKFLGTLRKLTPERFLSYWMENPIDAWTGTEWFQEEEGRFVSRLPIPEDARSAFLDMTRELVDYNLTRYRARKRSAQVIPLALRTTITAFPSLQAAAGAATLSLSLGSTPEAERVTLPLQTGGEGLFAVRASGDSMNGGKHPIRDGDWLVMRHTPTAGLGALEGKVALVQVAETAGHTYQVKRLMREGNPWMLRSDNPAFPSRQVSEEVVSPIAVLVEVIAPEQLGPLPGTRVTDDTLPKTFGLELSPRSGRYDGHLFLFVDNAGPLPDQARLDLPFVARHPAETAFVLTRAAPDEPWTYAGVARWWDTEGRWALGVQ